VKFLDVAITIAIAFLLQTVVGRYLPAAARYVDLFTVLTASFGLLRGRTVGMCTGAVAGLVQDAFSGGLLGFNGIAKTTVGYLTGIAGHHLIIRGWSSRILFFVLASALDLGILAALGFAAELPRVVGEGAQPFYVCFGNALAGMLLLRILGRGNSGDLA
jgi:rod shape-determining protein MreD